MSLFQYVETREFQVQNPLFRVATNVDATYTDTQDIGFFGQYYTGSAVAYTGLFRDATDGNFKLFTGLTDIPTVTDGSGLVNTAGTGYTRANLELQDLHGYGNTIIEGDLTVNGTVVTVNATTLSVEDNIILANSGPSGQLEDAGFVVKRIPANIDDDTPKQSGTSSANSGNATTITLQATNGHGTTLDYYKGWIIKLGGDVTGTAIVTASTAANPPVLTIDTAASGNITTSTTYELYNKQHVGMIYDESTDYMTFYGFPLEDARAIIDPAGNSDGNLADYVNIRADSIDAKGSVTAATGLTATTGNITASAGNVSASGSVSGNTVSSTTTITAGTDITSTAGNISASSGNVSASGTVTAGTDITSTAGNISASSGNVSASGTVTGGTGVTATTGDVTASSGNVSASGTVTAGTGITSTTGDITASSGNVSASGTVTAGTGLTVTTGNLAVSSGNATISGDLTVSGVYKGPMNIDDNIFAINTGPTNQLEDGGFVVQRSATNVAAADVAQLSAVAIQTNYTATATTLLITNAATGTDYFKGWVITNSVDGIGEAVTIESSSESTGTHTLTLSSGFTSSLTAGSDTVNLYNKRYVGMIYDESKDEMRLVGFPREDGEAKIDVESPVNGNVPTYLNLTVGDLDVTGNFSFDGTVTKRTKTQTSGNYSLTSSDVYDHDVIYLDPTSATTTFTLPEISTLSIPTDTAIIFTVVNISASNKAIVSRSGSDTIEGQTTMSLNKQWLKMTLFASGASGSTWLIKG